MPWLCANNAGVASKHKKQLWPCRSRWALLAVALGAPLTTIAALNDIY